MVKPRQPLIRKQGNTSQCLDCMEARIQYRLIWHENGKGKHPGNVLDTIIAPSLQDRSRLINTFCRLDLWLDAKGRVKSYRDPRNLTKAHFPYGYGCLEFHPDTEEKNKYADTKN